MTEIAERNAEINQRRLGRGGGSGSGIRVTDPAALQRLVAEMQAQAQAMEAAEVAREAERRRREGAAYRTPKQRAADAAAAGSAAAAAEQEARVLEHKLDPAVDYYSVLGVDAAASAAEIKKAWMAAEAAAWWWWWWVGGRRGARGTAGRGRDWA